MGGHELVGLLFTSISLSVGEIKLLGSFLPNGISAGESQCLSSEPE